MRFTEEEHAAYRAVLILNTISDEFFEVYIGPYEKKSTAQAQVTRKLKKPNYVDGWVESTNNWERIDG